MEITVDKNGFFQGELVQSNRIIYTPSDFAKTSLTYLQEVGTLSAVKPHTSSRTGLSSYLFFVVTKGSGIVTYNNIDYKVKTGDCIFLDCKNPYKHLSSGELWSLKWVHFYGNNVASIYDKYKKRGGGVCFQSPDTELVVSLIDEIYEIAASNSYIRDMEIYEKLTTLLLLIMRESGSGEYHDKSIGKRQDLNEIKDYLDCNYTKKIRLDDLAEKFLISKYYLTHIFKNEFGISIQSYLLKARITKAKHHLRFSDKNIEEISAELGYDDPNFFTRMFKKTEGITPGEYRKKWLGKTN